MPYTDLVSFYEECYKIHGDNCKGVDWPNEEDTLTRYQVMLELITFDTFHKKSRPSVLDFGCGLGHMYDYITNHNLDIEYAGLDMSEVFVNRCREKYSDTIFYKADLLADEDDIPMYDYITMNGVLTEKNELTYDEMFSYFKELIKKVYQKCNYGIAFNVMSKDVDWEKDHLFHLPLNELSHFLTKEITRDFIIRYDYGLYEYTVYVYRRQH
jgi:cyclopropane fatty-acyl-phospholipid synthase-like methyltransferase